MATAIVCNPSPILEPTIQGYERVQLAAPAKVTKHVTHAQLIKASTTQVAIQRMGLDPVVNPQQQQNDINLLFFWMEMKGSLQKAGVIIPDNEMPFSADQIRKWLKMHPNELALLKKIEIRRQFLSIIPKEISELSLPNLEELIITKCGITEVPANFGCKWPNLKHIMIADTKLQTVPNDFGISWPKMEAVYLQRNELKSLPRGFGLAWNRLEEMMLFQNKLEKLPKHFGQNWTKLQVLDLSLNRLRGFLEGFGSNWNDLEILHLHDNPIEMLELGFGSNWEWWIKKREIILKNTLFQARLDNFMRGVDACEDIRKIYVEACKGGKWSIEFGLIPKGSQAAIFSQSRSIRIDPRISQEKAFGYYVFELLNALGMKDDKVLMDKVRKGQMDKESYAKEIERSEHQNMLKHHEIMQKAIQDLGWHPEVDVFSAPEPDFEVVWGTIKDTPHADYYREQWDRVRKGVEL